MTGSVKDVFKRSETLD